MSWRVGDTYDCQYTERNSINLTSISPLPDETVLFTLAVSWICNVEEDVLSVAEDIVLFEEEEDEESVSCSMVFLC